MDTINERFKIARKACNKNQEDWGKILGITRPGVSDIESGRRNVTDKHIKLLCIETIQGKFLSENWLRTGEGEMFVSLPEEDEFAAYLEDLLADDGENELYNIIKAVMKTYQELSPKSQETLRDISAKLVGNLKTGRED